MDSRPFLVVLDRQMRLDPRQFAPALIEAGLTRAEATALCRRQRGLVAVNTPQDHAGAVAAALTGAGADAMAMPAVDYQPPPRPVTVATIGLDDDGVLFPAMQAQGRPGVLPYSSLKLLVAALLEPEDGLTGILDTATTRASGGGSAAVAAVALEARRESGALSADAQRRIEQLLNPRFPLATLLSRGGDPDNFADFGVVTGESTPRQPSGPKAPVTAGSMTRAVHAAGRISEVNMHGHRGEDRLTPGLKAVLLLWDGSQLYRFEGHTGVYRKADGIPAAHWLVQFHTLATMIATRAAGAMVPPETDAFLEVDDDAGYLFADEDAITQFTRWWMARLSE